MSIAAALIRRVRMLARRAVVKLVYDDPRMQELQLAIFAGEVFDRVERFEDYGLTSHPIPGAEALVLALGGDTENSVVVKVGDRRYRLRGLAEGEVAIYDDQGQVIHLKRGKEIQVFGTDKLTADVAVETVVTCPLIRAVAISQVILDTPLTACTGNLQVAGGLSCLGTYGESGGKIQTPGDIQSTLGNVSDSTRSMAVDRDIYNGHTHAEHGTGGGTTSPPAQQM